jgi:hypothetical protein
VERLIVGMIRRMRRYILANDGATKMKKNTTCMGLFLVSLILLNAHPGSGNSSRGLEDLKTLIGDWEGTVQWSGERSDTGKMNATYSVAGNGTAIIENLINDGVNVMTSVYHVDGESLRMTHYCAAGNQPRLKASSYTQNPVVIKFEMVDITNLATPDVGHVSAAELILQDQNHIVLSFTFVRKNKKSIERIDLLRVDRKG